MSGVLILDWATQAALALLSIAFLLTVYRILRGPTLADRILGLDLITTLGIGFVVVIAARTGFELYVDIGIAIGLVGFLATVAFARYLITRGRRE